MRRVIVHAVLMVVVAVLLEGCGIAETRSTVPDFMRAKAVDTPSPEPPPDVRQVVRDKLDTVFVNTSNPREVRVSAPRRDLRGPGWTACVKAELTSVMGKPLGMETYRITVSGGAIIDRRRAEAADNCANESYEPI